MSNEHVDIESRMRPGAWDTSGFLLSGESLTERITEDLRSCAQLGVSTQAIGLQLASLLESAAGTDIGRPRHFGNLRIEITHQRGMLTCPWAADEFEACPLAPNGRPTANRFRLTRNGLALEGFELSAHLIGAHQFFGGTRSRFRIEPAAAAAILSTT